MPALIVILAVVVAVAATTRLERWERLAAFGALGGQLVCSVVQYFLQEHYYGGITDARAYMGYGEVLARLLERDFFRFAPEIGRLVLHLDSSLPFEVFGEGRSTGTMCGIAAVIVFVFGNSLLSACLAASVVAWVGLLLIYRVARKECAPSERRLALGACLFVPSVMFWSAAYAKEALVMLPFGALLWGTHGAVKRRSIPRGIFAVLGAVGVLLLKPYILLPFAFAMAAWVYAAFVWSRASASRVHPLQIVVPIVLAVGTVALVGKLVPQFSADQMAETLATQQGYWKETEGGSAINMGNVEARTLAGQLPFLGLGLINALFRPFVFEARNAPALAAALETAGITFVVAATLFRSSWSRFTRSLMVSPALVFCAAFVICFGMVVGVFTANLGSLSRYRMPMMPFYVGALLLLRRRLQASLPRIKDARLAEIVARKRALRSTERKEQAV